MALDDRSAVAQATSLAELHEKERKRNGRIGKIERYLDGEHDLPYMPRGAKREYRKIAERSVTNWLPLVSDTFAKALFVDGYRGAKATEDAAPWGFWQANGLDARQTIAHRGALEYGTSYTLVLPGEPAPLIRPIRATRTTVVFEDEDDEWPVFGLVAHGRGVDGGFLWRLYDDEAEWLLRQPKDRDALEIAGRLEHGLGVCPLVRFRNRLDGDPHGIIEPLFALQDRINESVFALMIALQYASFRQRWATGMAIPLDDQETLPDGSENPNFGKPVEAFAAAVDRLWVTDNPEAKFGDFAQTEVSGHLRTYESAVKTLAAIAQTPPHVLMGELVNLSADALAAVESSTTRKSGEYETLFGESWEQALRLAARAAGDAEAAQDTESQVRWRDTEARSLAQSVDALGKMGQMLAVPVEALWERIPGVTQTDVELWKSLRTEGDVFGALVGEIQRQAAPTTPAAPAVPTA